MSLPPGTKAFVQLSAPSSLPSGPASGLLYQRQQRDGRMVLVETTYDAVKGIFGQGTPKSSAAARTTTVAPAKPQPMGQDCGVKFNPESTGDANQLRGLVCLLLTQDGQGTTLSDGTRLFRRYGEIEHWKGDVILQRSYGLVVRDGQSRYWFLEFRGWL